MSLVSLIQHETFFFSIPFPDEWRSDARERAADFEECARIHIRPPASRLIPLHQREKNDIRPRSGFHYYSQKKEERKILCFHYSWHGRHRKWSMSLSFFSQEYIESIIYRYKSSSFWQGIQDQESNPRRSQSQHIYKRAATAGCDPFALLLLQCIDCARHILVRVVPLLTARL